MYCKMIYFVKAVARPLFFSLFFFGNSLFADMPPIASITAEEHCAMHPEDLQLHRKIKPFPFIPNPVTNEVPKPWPDARVLTLPQGRCYGVYGIVFTQDNLLLADASYEFGPSSLPHSILSKRSLTSSQYYDADVAEIGALSCDNYYHWMIDVLPRIGLIEEAGLTPDFYHTTFPESSFRLETLSHLGIDLDKIIPAEKNLHIQAKTLIVPTIVSMPNCLHKDDHMLLCAPLSNIEFLRRKFLLEEPKVTNKRLYISRKLADKRRVLNEDKLMKMLQSYGFEFILLENLSVIEQVNLFASAEIIIGPHGAGLTNTVFCRPGTKIIELSPLKLWHWSFCFWAISQQLNLDHTYLRCKGNKANFHDMVVNIQDLETELKRYLSPQ